MRSDLLKIVAKNVFYQVDFVVHIVETVLKEVNFTFDDLDDDKCEVACSKLSSRMCFIKLT